MLFHTLHRPVQVIPMPIRRKTAVTSSCQPLLFRSGQSEKIYPSEHRNSVIEESEKPNEFSLTRALLESHPEQFTAATQAPFLEAAGKGRLSKLTLSRWLSQDRLYAETYICFIASLIARVHLPYAFVDDKSRSLRWRIVRLLSSALENIHRELEFFEVTAQKYDLDLQAPMNGDQTQPFMPVQATQQYMDLFRSFHSDSTLSLLEGLVVLWGTEQCYLSAWSYAAKLSESCPSEQNEDGGALRREFIPNWSSADFQKFVNDIGAVTDELAFRDQAANKLEVYKAVWSHVLDIETRFWPQTDS